MRKLLFLFCTIALLAGCKHDEDESPSRFNRTVLVYVSGENTLSPFIGNELREMLQGSKGIGNNALVVYVDDANSSHLPYVMRLKEGAVADSVVFEKDELSSNPDVMGRVLRYTSEHYPATDYGLVLWGHGTGWMLEDSMAWARTPRKGYGIDNGSNALSDNGKWLNMNSLGRVLSLWGQPLRFVMADCCQFQCIESAYELRNATDYIIGAPSEIPGEGAPYNTMIPQLFSTASDFYKGIVDAYYAQVISGYRVPLSVIKTSMMGQLARQTALTLKTFALPATECPDLHGLIYYKGTTRDRSLDVMYDMNDFMLHYAPEAAYGAWKQVFDSTVVYRKMASPWMSYAGRAAIQVDFSSFEMTEKRFGGVSMFVPQNRKNSQYQKYNADIRLTGWYWAAGLDEIGW